jgi:ABC-type Fe3+ transport system substrate-binding protein
LTTKAVIALGLGYVVIAALIGGLILGGVLQVQLPSNSASGASTVSCLYKASTQTYGRAPNMTETAWIGFKVNVTSLVQGSFTSTSPVDVYIAPSEPGVALNGTYYTYSNGNTTSGNIYVTLAPAYYYFVVTNPSTVPAKVSVASCITITALPSAN